MYVTIGCKDNKLIIYLFTKSEKRQSSSIKKTVKRNYPSSPVNTKTFAKSPCIIFPPSERSEAMIKENKMECQVKKIIDKGIGPFVIVDVNFFTRDNLTLHIKNLSNKTMKKVNHFGISIDNDN